MDNHPTLWVDLTKTILKRNALASYGEDTTAPYLQTNPERKIIIEEPFVRQRRTEIGNQEQMETKKMFGHSTMC